MAIIKKSELKSLDNKKIEEKITNLRDRIMKTNFQRSTKTTPENPGQINEVRRTIARLLFLQKKLSEKPKEGEQKA